jgi:hypothetical protein
MTVTGACAARSRPPARCAPRAASRAAPWTAGPTGVCQSLPAPRRDRPGERDRARRGSPGQLRSARRGSMLGSAGRPTTPRAPPSAATARGNIWQRAVRANLLCDDLVQCFGAVAVAVVVTRIEGAPACARTRVMRPRMSANGALGLGSSRDLIGQVSGPRGAKQTEADDPSADSVYWRPE